MKRFLRNVFLLVLPFAIAVSVEMMLPVDYFCFRPVEALSVCTFTNLFPGPFYPWSVLDREEVGNLAAHTSYAVPRLTHWMTDRYGFRYDESIYSGDQFDVVLVGDSQIQGSGITQSDMLDAVLAKRTGLHIYPYAAYTLNDFLEDPRFKQFPPRLVIFARTESGIPNIPERKAVRHERSAVYRGRWALRWVVLADRLTKMAMLHHVLAMGRYGLKRIYAVVQGKPSLDQQALSAYAQLSTTGNMIHLSAEIRQARISDDDIETYARRLSAYQEELNSRGIAFLFFPIPNKSSIYYETVPWKNPPDFLARLCAAAARYHVQQIDTLPAYIAAARKLPSKTLLYQTDDTHWSREGVMLAGDLLLKSVNLLAIQKPEGGLDSVAR